LNSAGHPGQARAFFDQALDPARKITEDSYAVDALHMLAVVAPPGSGLDINLQALQFAEGSGDESARSWQGSLNNNTGWSYHEMGDDEATLKILKQDETRQRSKRRTAESCSAAWTMTRTLRSLARVEHGPVSQLALKDGCETAGESDGYICKELRECLLTRKREDNARPYFGKAFQTAA